MNEKRPIRALWDFLDRVDSGFAAVLKTAMVVAGLLLAGLMVFEVILRYLLEVPFLGAEETSILLGLWLYAMGAVYAARLNAHIAGGILAVLKLSDRTRRIANVAALLVCVVVSGVYAYYSLAYTAETFASTQVSSYLHWPYGIWTLSLTVGFILMTLYFGVWIVKVWRAPPSPRME